MNLRTNFAKEEINGQDATVVGAATSVVAEYYPPQDGEGTVQAVVLGRATTGETFKKTFLLTFERTSGSVSIKPDGTLLTPLQDDTALALAGVTVSTAVVDEVIQLRVTGVLGKTINATAGMRVQRRY